MSLSDPNNPLARLQGASTDQTSNPFDLKIRRPVLKGLWPSNRKEKKEKKNEKKTSTNSKTLKPTTNPQAMATSIIDEQNFPSSNLDETNEFHRMMGSIDGINQIPNLTKSKCVRDEVFLSFENFVSFECFRCCCSQHQSRTRNRVRHFRQVRLIVLVVKVQFHFHHRQCENLAVRVTAAMMMMTIIRSQKFNLKLIQQDKKLRPLSKKMTKQRLAMQCV